MGIRAAKKTLNIDAYIEFHEQLSSLGMVFCNIFVKYSYSVGPDAAGPKDDEWIHHTRQSALITTGTLLDFKPLSLLL